VLVGFAHELLTLAGHTPWTLVETAGRRASRRQPQRRESPLGGTHRAYIWANCRMGAITPSVFGSHVSMMAFANSRSRRSMNNPETACTRFWTGG
jgi:hypothetical protein